LDQADSDLTGAEYAQLNRRFHEVLYAPSKLHRLLAMLGPLHTTFDRYIRVYYEVMKHRSLAQQEHRRILELCRGRDADAAAKELEQHIRNAVEDVLLYLEQEKGLGAEAQPGGATRSRRGAPIGRTRCSWAATSQGWRLARRSRPLRPAP
jgi:DNA-binding GntR family transcriptional regulator